MNVVELPVSISVEVSDSVAFFQWDSINHEEIPLGSQDISVPMDITVSVFLTSTGELMAAQLALFRALVFTKPKAKVLLRALPTAREYALAQGLSWDAIWTSATKSI